MGEDGSMEPSEPLGHTDAAGRVLSMIDHTALGDNDTEADIARLCAEAATPEGAVAAVCTWPRLIAIAHELLGGSDIGIASVSNFPTGTGEVSATVAEAQAAVAAGATEIDVVVPWEAHRDGDSRVVETLVAAVRKALDDHIVLKAILETGELSEPSLIESAGRAAAAAGADFLKTSSGKTPHSATHEAAEILLGVAAEHREHGHTVGVKISGGVRDLAAANAYLEIADRIMGPTWATPFTFRFGASSLLPDVLARLAADHADG